jgi:3'(2'), 5'-bisphosphate nucleotidase
VAASLSHFSDTIKEILNVLEPVEIKRIGGAGNKVCNLALATVDCYIHPSPGLMYWDLCAPESLVKGMGGYATDLYQGRLRYDPNAPNYKLKGLICAKHPPMYETIKMRMGETLLNISKRVKL